MKRILPFLTALCFLTAVCAVDVSGALQSREAIASWFPGKRICLFDGAVIDEDISPLVENAKITWLNNYADMAAALRAGQIDGFFCEEPLAPFVCDSSGGLYATDVLLNEENYACVFAKNNKRLCGQLNKTIARLTADGTLKQMQKKWGSLDESVRVMPEIELTGENGTLRVATSNSDMPFGCLQDGKYIGYDFELLARFAEEYGYALKYDNVEWAATTAAVISGKYDMGIGCMLATEERGDAVLFSDPIWYSGIVLIVSDKYAPAAKAKVPVETARIGGMTGTSCETYAVNNYPDAQYSSFSGTGDMMAALKSGKLDYCVVSEIDAINYRRSDRGFTIVDSELEKGTFSIAAAKGSGELVSQMNALIDKYEKDGTLAQMKQNWIRPDGSDYVINDIPVRADAPELRVAFCSGLEPSCFVKDGTVTGYDIELAQRLAYDLGYRLTLSDMDFSALIAAIESGRADIAVSGITATEERAQKVDFTRSYYDDPLVLVSYVNAAANDEGFFTGVKNSFRKTFIVENRWKLIVKGIGITLLLSVCSGLAGILIGFGLCMMRMSRKSAPQAIAVSITRLLQGTPMVVLLMIFYYIVFNKSGLDGISVSIIAFGLNFGAYASEILLSGINAVDPGQREAAAAIGFTPAQTFVKIVFPQAARHFLPVLKGEYISLVKTTSVVGYVAVQDLTKASDMIRSRTYEAFFPLIVTAIIYFLLAYGLSSLLKLAELRVDPKRRPRALKGVELQ